MSNMSSVSHCLDTAVWTFLRAAISSYALLGEVWMPHRENSLISERQISFMKVLDLSYNDYNYA